MGIVIFFGIVFIVIVLLKFTPSQTAAAKHVTNDNNIQLAQIANDVRILMESMKIIGQTKNYQVKESRTRLAISVLSRLGSYWTDHIVKNEDWTKIVENYTAFAEEMKTIEARHYQKIARLKGDRTPTRCPYCLKDTFPEGSRMLKCGNCGKTAARLKINKNEYMMITKEEQQKIKDIEEEALNANPQGGDLMLSVSPQVGLILSQMEMKLKSMGNE